MFFVSRPVKIVTFLRKNGDSAKRVIVFLLERNTFRNKFMEIVRDFDEKSYNNNGKPLKSSRFLRVKPKLFIFQCSSFFLHFSSFFVFSFFIFSFFIEFHFFFFLFSFFLLSFFFFFLSCSFIFISLSFSFLFSFIFLSYFFHISFIFFHILSFSFIFFHFIFLCWVLKIWFFFGPHP